MKLSVFSLLLATVSAEMNLEGSIGAESAMGKNILNRARALNNNNNNYYAWIQNYSIKFDGCAQVPRFEREEGFRSDLLAKFKLCPTGGSCRNAGEYVVDMRELVEAYQEAKQQENEATCENAVQGCEYQCQNGLYQYNGDDDQGCLYTCLADEKLEYCAQDQQQDQRMDDIGECRAMNEEQNNGNNYQYDSDYQIYYVGAYCTSKGVFAGTFTDSACTKHAPSGTYEKLNYGYSLPTNALVPSGIIAKCEASGDDDANNNGYQLSEVCESLYEQSAKCERKVKNISYQDNSGCDLIHNILPRMNYAFRQMQGKPSHGAVWAWIFGIACVCMGAYIFLLHKRVIREKVDMNKLGLV